MENSDKPKETINIIYNNNNEVDNSDNGISDNNNNSNSINKFIEDYIKKRIKIIDGKEYYKQGDKLRYIVKSIEEKLTLIDQAHQIGHEGVYKTYNRLKRDYYWKYCCLIVNVNFYTFSLILYFS